MLSARTRDLDLMGVWFDSDPASARVDVTFPINRATGATDSAVVYFELAPGGRLPIHTDSAEETLYIVAGEVEARVGDERRRLGEGDLALIPAMEPHGLENVGEERVKVIGFFSEPTVTSTFGEPIQPIGSAVVEQGVPAPTAA